MSEPAVRCPGREHWRTNPNHIANRLTKAIRAAGYDTKPAHNGYAVLVYRDPKLLATVWLPLGEPTPTGLGNMYLWGPSGDEYRAPDTTDLDGLVQLIVETLP